ncbi:hypothetical protein LSAT2_020265, partial [Lamellibrachia satsuma]
QKRAKYCDGEMSFPCSEESSTCNLFPCDDPYAGVDWTPCSASCGGGTRSRVDNTGENMEEISCNMQDCEPVCPLADFPPTTVD